MTWGGGKPHAVGDQGQRYEVTCTGMMEDPGERHVFGWTNSLKGAGQMCEAVRLHPSLDAPEIKDRGAAA